MTARKPLPKTLRFQVLERDGFQCRYCGAKPPDGALHVDHIIPVCEGGASSADNLITSCEPCNSGKGRRKVAKSQPLPDMGAMADEAEAFSAEVARWRKAHKKLEATLDKAAEQMREEHNTTIAPQMIRKAIVQYGIAEVDYAAGVTGAKFGRMDYEQATAYFFGVLRKRRAEGTDTADMPTYVKPAEVIQKSSCVFGFYGSCGNSGGCVWWEDDKGTPGEWSCTKLVDACGGWDNKHLILHVSDFVEAWRRGDAVEWLLDGMPNGSRQ